ncbi:class D sortase [Virgibacillus xinjiangensis]|uniref:Class D sortase n=1 Tax=Virgibacillus xinjiangensis TaxID=393090 RepID=A0ABV7CW13_9BACI
MIRRLSVILFVLGVSLVSYNGWQYYESTRSVQEIPDQKDAPSIDTVKANEQETRDTVNKESTREASVSPMTFDYNIAKGEEVAELDIPKLDKRFTTYWGTDEDTLGQGVGMYVSEWTTIPNREGGHTVLSGHRDTVFIGLDELGEGDTLEVHYDDETFVYKIKETWITDAEDRSVIVEKDKPTLTLTTCYPFNYVGYAPDRYIVQAELVD